MKELRIAEENDNAEKAEDLSQKLREGRQQYSDLSDEQITVEHSLNVDRMTVSDNDFSEMRKVMAARRNDSMQQRHRAGLSYGGSVPFDATSHPLQAQLVDSACSLQFGEKFKLFCLRATIIGVMSN